MGPATVTAAPDISVPTSFFNVISVSPKGITRLFNMVSVRKPPVNSALLKSSNEKEFSTGSKVNPGMS